MKHWLFAVMLVCFGAVGAKADPDNRSAIEVGTFLTPYKIAGSSTAGTALVAPDGKRLDGVFFNNTATAIWIGTTTATGYLNLTHNNISDGFPVLASSTFRLGGAMTGALAFTCNPTASICEVRTLEGAQR